MATRVLIIAGDVLPLPGYATTGAGLRAWGIGQGLKSAGFEVEFSMPSCYVKHSDTGAVRDLSWDWEDRERPIRRARPDVVVICHWPAMPSRRLGVPTVLDLHGPHLMERYFWDPERARAGVAEKLAAFRNADYFVCAGERQRFYFANWLLMAGFPMDSSLIGVVPVSVSPELPERKARGASVGGPVIVYGGLFLPWQDPVMPIRALVDAMDATGRGMLHVFGGPHPVVKDTSGRFEKLCADLEAHPRVRLHEPLAREPLLDFYLGADMAFDLMAPNLERELAFTTRTVEYLWCGLPVIYNDYAELSGLIAKHQAGWTLPVSDPVALRQHLEEILGSSGEIAARGENAWRAVRQALAWDRTIEPLAAFCREPFRTSPGRALAEVVAAPRAPAAHRLVRKAKRVVKRLLGRA